LDFDKAIGLDSRDADAYSGRGAVKYLLGDYAGAIADLENAVRIQPENSGVFQLRGTAKILIGDNTGALQGLRACLKAQNGTRKNQHFCMYNVNTFPQYPADAIHF